MCRWTGSTDRGLEGGVKMSVGGVALGSEKIHCFRLSKNSAPDAGLILLPGHYCQCELIPSAKAKVATGVEGTGAAHSLAGFVLLYTGPV